MAPSTIAIAQRTNVAGINCVTGEQVVALSIQNDCEVQNLHLSCRLLHGCFVLAEDSTIVRTLLFSGARSNLKGVHGSCMLLHACCFMASSSSLLFLLLLATVIQYVNVAKTRSVVFRFASAISRVSCQVYSSAQSLRILFLHQNVVNCDVSGEK